MKKEIGIILGIIGILFIGVGTFFNSKGTAAISIIGGADGPTSIFLVGKTVGSPATAIIVIGILLVAAGILYAIKKGKKNK